MNKSLKKGFFLTALGITFVAFSANEGCEVLINDDWDSDYSYDDDTYEEGDDAENRLLVSGSGEFLEIEYNHLVFSARINWDSGLYFFAPDPEGRITGDRIICAASINEDEVEGDCFRSGRVCHFNYWHDEWTTVDDKDVYELGTTTCKKGGDVGPFLVPLESPLCGEDPFPACPSDDIFPTGPQPEDEEGAAAGEVGAPPVDTPQADTPETGTNQTENGSSNGAATEAVVAAEAVKS